MMSSKFRMFLAVVVFVSGLVVVVRSYQGTLPPVVADAYSPPVTDIVYEALDESVFDVQPKRGEMVDIYQEIHRRVREGGERIARVRNLGSKGEADLGEAFVERVRLLVEPEFERDYEASVRRGDPMARDDAAELFEKYAQFTNDMKRITPLSLEGVEVEIVEVRSGVDLIRELKMNQGFGRTTGSRNAEMFPVGDHPLESGYLVVEVTMPMMRFDHILKKLKGAIIGYRFVWVDARGQWVPYESVIYTDMQSAFSPPRL